MRAFRLILSPSCGGRKFFHRADFYDFFRRSLFFFFCFLMIFGSDLIVKADPPRTAPGTNWSLVWKDDFNGSSIDTNYWNVFSRNKGWGSEKYRPGQVTVANGICTFTAVKEGNDYWSGGLTNRGKKGVISYGYYEMHCKLPLWTGGQWAAFWLVGCNGNWMPEFDIVDGTNWGNNCFFTNPHWRDSIGAHKQVGFNACPEGGNITADFHTYGFLWTKDSCVWYFDNKKIRYWKTDPMIPDCPNPIILNFEMGGWGGRTIADSTLPWTMKIDWVGVWKIEKTATSNTINSFRQQCVPKLSHRAHSLSHLTGYLEP